LGLRSPSRPRAFDCDPQRVKQELFAWRQLIDGHRLVTLHGTSTQRTENRSNADAVPYARTLFGAEPEDHGTATESAGETNGSTESESETYLPVYKTFQELSSREFMSFEEQQLHVLQRLVGLPDQHACLLRKGEAGRFFRVQHVHPVSISDDEIAEHDRQVLANPANPYSAPAVIEAEINGRIRLLEAAEAEAVQTERQLYASIPEAGAEQPRSRPPLRRRAKKNKKEANPDDQ
jgi:hypothetical protein